MDTRHECSLDIVNTKNEMNAAKALLSAEMTSDWFHMGRYLHFKGSENIQSIIEGFEGVHMQFRYPIMELLLPYYNLESPISLLRLILTTLVFYPKLLHN